MEAVFLVDYPPWSKGQQVNLVDNVITRELIQREVINLVPVGHEKTAKDQAAEIAKLKRDRAKLKKQLKTAPVDKQFTGAANK